MEAVSQSEVEQQGQQQVHQQEQQEVLVEFTPEREGLSAKGHEEFTVMLSLKAPFYEEKNRAPIDIITVIDRSGSMQGSKMDLVKETLKFVVKQLRADDNLSIVIYDNVVDVLTPLTGMNAIGKEKVIHDIGTITARGGTDLCAGLIKGVNVAQSKKNDVTSVLLFTDGLTNEGIQSIDGIVGEITKLEDNGKLPCIIHTFGFGSDHAVNILKAISDKGNGSYFFIENKDTIPNAFADCLGGLLSVVAQNLNIEIEGDQVPLVTVHTTFKSTIVAGKTIITIGDIQSEEEKDFLCVLKVPVLEAGQKLSLVKAKVSYFNVLTSKQEDASSVCLLGETADVDSLPANEKIDVQKNRMITTAALLSAKAHGDSGNLEKGRAVLREAIAKLKSSKSANNKYVLSLIRDLEESLSGLQDRQTYTTCGGYTMSTYSSAHTQQRATHTTTAYSTTSRQVMSSRLPPQPKN